MEQARKIREELRIKYEELLMIESKLDEDILLGLAGDSTSVDFEELCLTYQKAELGTKLFENLKPYFMEVKRLASRLLELVKNTTIEDIDFSSKWCEELSKFDKKYSDALYYDYEDLGVLKILKEEAEQAMAQGDKRKLTQVISDFRIARNCYRLCTYEQENDLFNTFQSTIQNLKDRIELLLDAEKTQE